MPVSLREQEEAVERMRWVLLAREPMPSNRDERYELAAHLEEAVGTLQRMQVEEIRERDLARDRATQVTR